ncbi:MAG TPA: galactitol-1-phosphate 5-dehydrogenase [Sedimentisphaerales bacterium]|nr:galactitol-1-phosphate 5-dehydrogenase [Sedimentisphaerales bacterium]
MKALIYTAPYSFEYSDFPNPQVGPDDVLIRVKACGICGSDVHGATGKTGRRLPPLIMGHEAAGVVEQVGGNVKGFARGDRVCFDSTVYCNECPPCREGRFNRCQTRQVLGVSPGDFKRHGAMAEFVAVPWWIVSKIPDDMSFVRAALLEPVSIGVHAASRVPITPDDTVVVIGAGTIGLFIIQAAKLRGPAKVIAADINEFRLGIAKKLGADAVVNPSQTNLKEAVLSQTDGKGANVTLEAVGYARTFSDAISITKTGGCVVAVGNLEPRAEFNLQELVARELTFTGSYASSGEFRNCIDLVALGRIDVDPLISDVVPLSEGAAAFDRLLKAQENLLKIVLEP